MLHDQVMSSQEYKMKLTFKNQLIVFTTLVGIEVETPHDHLNRSRKSITQNSCPFIIN